MGRPTESFSLYSQQFGRALRLMLAPEVLARYDTLTNAGRREAIAQSGKPFAIIIDHVGNVVRHRGPPDKFMDWSLDAREGRGAGGSGAQLHRACTGCSQPYERFRKCCPYCGEYPAIPERSAPEFVDGDLIELDPAVLAAMRGEIARIDAAPNVGRADGAVAGAIRRTHWERQEAQGTLRAAMAWFAGLEEARLGASIDEQRKLFFERFGVDVGTAQTLNTRDAEALRVRVAAEVGKFITLPEGV